MIIYVDMDGVIADFAQARIDQGLQDTPSPDKHVDYSKIPVMPGAKAAIEILCEEHDVYIASTPPWRQPKAWTDKRLWIQKHFPALSRKVFLTHHKDLLIGDILVDDSNYRGQPDFEGKWLWFGKPGNYDWRETLINIQKIYEKVQSK